MKTCVLAVLMLAGCGGGWAAAPSSSGDGGMAAMYGYGKPTLEVTINGVHFGPSAPERGSVAEMVNGRDPQSGRVIQSTFRVGASSLPSGATCEMSMQRYGQNGVEPITTGAYLVQSGGEGASGTTPDGAVSPVAGARVSVPQGTFSCSGATCNGGAFSLTHLGGDYIEGYIGVPMQHEGGLGYTQVVCSFYLPSRIVN